MPTTSTLIPLRPLPSLSVGQSLAGRPVSAVRGVGEVPSTLDQFDATPWLGETGDYSESRRGFNFSQDSGADKRPRPDQEFYNLSALFSPLADGFSVIGIAASEEKASSPAFMSYLPLSDSIEGIGIYEMNTRIVQGLARSSGAALDYVL